MATSSLLRASVASCLVRHPTRKCPRQLELWWFECNDCATSHSNNASNLDGMISSLTINPESHLIFGRPLLLQPSLFLGETLDETDCFDFCNLFVYCRDALAPM